MKKSPLDRKTEALCNLAGLLLEGKKANQAKRQIKRSARKKKDDTWREFRLKIYKSL